MTTEQTSNQAGIQPLSQTVPLQRADYRTSAGAPLSGTSPALHGEVRLDQEQYYQPLERFHGSTLHGWGIAAGLHVLTTLGALNVTVQPGIALDSNGLHIMLVTNGSAKVGSPDNLQTLTVGANGLTVPTAGLIGDQYLIMQFSEDFNTDGTISTFTHSPWLHFVAATNLPLDESSILLARVTFDGDPNVTGGGPNAGQVLTLDESMRQKANGHIERAYEFSVQGPAIIKGLDVQGTPGSPGITVLPGLALDGTGQYVSLTSGVLVETGDVPGATSTSLVTVNDNGITLDTTNQVGQKYLLLQAWETPRQVSSLPSLPAQPSTLQPVAPFHFTSTPWLRFSDILAEDGDAPSILLADVEFGTGGEIVNVSPIRSNALDFNAGTLHVLSTMPSFTLGNNGTVSTEEVGMIRPINVGSGMALTVPHASDEIHFECEEGEVSGGFGIFSKLVLGAQNIVVRDTTLNDNLTIEGQTGDLATNGLITAQGGITAQGDITTHSGITAQGGITTQGDITTRGLLANGSATINGTLTVASTTNNNGGIRTNGGNIITSGGTISTNGGPIISGTATASDITASGKITANSLSITNGVSVAGTLAAGSTTITGSLKVSGQKQFVHPHPYDETKQIAYVSLEGGESGTYIRGTGTLISGKAVVELPEHFRLVTHEQGLTIQLTPRGEWLQLYVVELDTAHIVVGEAQDKNGAFDYLLQGMREGYEDHQAIQEKVR